MSNFRIIKRSTLIAFYTKHHEAKKTIELWYSEIKELECKNFNELKAVYKSASLIANNRMIFNIKGNDYRLIVKINFYTKIIYVIWLGSHKEYDNIDVASIRYKQ